MVTVMDLANGASSVLFQAPSGSFLSAGIASSDGKQILLAYAAPPPGGKAGYGLTDLYLMPADGSARPTLFLQRKDPQESFFSPVWSPDGNTIYYTHFFYTDPKAAAFQYQIERVGADKKPEILVKDALLPRLSPDGKKLGYLAYDPVSKENELTLADADGKNPVPVIQKGTFSDVDSFMFSPDGLTIIFSAVNPATSLNFWWEKLLGIQVAYAHDVSSDWYRVSVSGGTVERLTRLNDTSFYGNFSPDGKHIAFICSTGLFVMDPDGGQLTQISNSVQAGTVDWIP
jgi:Tol biopolymer transport system component